MRNNIIYILLTVLILSSCGSDKQPLKTKAFIFDNQTSGTNFLIGKWIISSVILRTNDNESEALCNLCPTINFNNNTALITFANNTTDGYNWNVVLDTLILQSTNSKTTLPYFLHLKYKMEYNQKKEFLELKLSPNKDMTYILRRQN